MTSLINSVLGEWYKKKNYGPWQVERLLYIFKLPVVLMSIIFFKEELPAMYIFARIVNRQVVSRLQKFCWNVSRDVLKKTCWMCWVIMFLLVETKPYFLLDSLRQKQRISHFYFYINRKCFMIATDAWRL